MQPQAPMRGDWDYLIVLDACRYDVFADVYDEYLDGSLDRRRSPGSSTPEWAAKVFDDEYDLTYVSANPFINGVGVALDETKWGSSCGYSWRADNHFEEVLDVWQFGWDDDLGTVPPEAVNSAVADHGLPDDGRAIVHYLQPHAPYISGGVGRKLEQLRDGVVEGGDADGGALASLRRRVESRLADSELAMKLGMLVELSPKTLLNVGREESRAVIERHYERNLRLALESVQDLVDRLDGQVVVTADHGEAFGEEGVWEHHVECHIPPLIEVPWLEVA